MVFACFSDENGHLLTALQSSAAPLYEISQTVEYIYDLANRRIGKEVDQDGDGMVDHRGRYVWDVASPDGKGNVVLDFVDADLDGEAEGSELSRRYLWANMVDQLFAQENVDDLVSAAAADVDWMLTDNLGTIRDVVRYDEVSGTTSVAEHFTFGAFGDLTSGDASITRYLFTGQEYDADLGLYYYDQRWYDAGTGQFLSPDPAEDDQENTYRYVGNNPTNGVDPTGLEVFLPNNALGWAQSVVSNYTNVKIRTVPVGPHHSYAFVSAADEGEIDRAVDALKQAGKANTSQYKLLHGLGNWTVHDFTGKKISPKTLGSFDSNNIAAALLQSGYGWQGIKDHYPNATQTGIVHKLIKALDPAVAKILAGNGNSKGFHLQQKHTWNNWQSGTFSYGGLNQGDTHYTLDIRPSANPLAVAEAITDWIPQTWTWGTDYQFKKGGDIVQMYQEIQDQCFEAVSGVTAQ